MHLDRTSRILLAALIILLVAGPFLPRWAMFMLNVSLSWGTVVLGLLAIYFGGIWWHVARKGRYAVWPFGS